MEISTRNVPDKDATYLPLGIRPEPYPPGFRPDPVRYSGDLLVRAVVTGEDVDEGLPMAESAPVPRNRLTCRRTKSARSVHADELPVTQRMAIVTSVTDDPGWLAIQGQKVFPNYGPCGRSTTDDDNDPWQGSPRVRVELPIGGVLVSRTGVRSSEPRGWKIWRVLPAGATAVLESIAEEDGSGSERAAIARAIDRDLKSAFDAAVEKLQAHDPEAAQSARAAIERWYVDETRPTARTGGKKKGANREKRRGR